MTTDTLVQIPVRLDVEAAAPTFLKAMSRLDAAAVHELDRAGIEPGLRELVRLRASQLNGCAYCVDTHARDAAAVGEPEQRIRAVAVWREAPFFTARERAALALTDAVTRLSETHVPDDVHAEAAAHFTDEELAALLTLVVTINAWNALSLASRSWAPQRRW